MERTIAFTHLLKPSQTFAFSFAPALRYSILFQHAVLDGGSPYHVTQCDMPVASIRRDRFVWALSVNLSHLNPRCCPSET